MAKQDSQKRSKASRYADLIVEIFNAKYKEDVTEIPFERKEIISAASKLDIDLPLNLGDVVYSFRYRANLPDPIRSTAPKDMEWIIRPVGQAKYLFCLVNISRFLPNKQLGETKIPDATPGIITKYAMNDEQGLLAKVRYNRLIDIFTGITCYSLQNHLRTTVPGMGQVETDEVYVGIEKRGGHYIFPVQAKGGKDQLGIVQIEQDFALCKAKFPHLIAIPIAVQFIDHSLIAMFSFEQDKEMNVRISAERHYRLVPPSEISQADLDNYMIRPNT